MSGLTYMSTLGGAYVDRIILNEDYDPGRNDYDIALMRLSSPISVGGQREFLLTDCSPFNRQPSNALRE